jgi:hypothetical protein
MVSTNKNAANEDAKYSVYDKVLIGKGPNGAESDSDDDNERKHFKALYALD